MGVEWVKRCSLLRNYLAKINKHPVRAENINYMFVRPWNFESLCVIKVIIQLFHMYFKVSLYFFRHQLSVCGVASTIKLSTASSKSPANVTNLQREISASFSVCCCVRPAHVRACVCVSVCVGWLLTLPLQSFNRFSCITFFLTIALNPHGFSFLLLD